jgi:hypothetical protein
MAVGPNWWRTGQGGSVTPYIREGPTPYEQAVLDEATQRPDRRCTSPDTMKKLTENLGGLLHCVRF